MLDQLSMMVCDQASYPIDPSAEALRRAHLLIRLTG